MGFFSSPKKTKITFNKDKPGVVSLQSGGYTKPVEVDLNSGWEGQRKALKELKRAGVKNLPDENDRRGREKFFKQLKEDTARADKFGKTSIDTFDKLPDSGSSADDYGVDKVA